jgi:hypothetical protein
MRNVVVTDLDGTLVNIGVKHMTALADGLWEYHQVARLATPNLRLARILETHVSRGRIVVAVTARDTRWANVTRWWLKENVPALATMPLYMRSYGDDRPDDVIKMELLARVVKDHGEIGFFHDDHPGNVALAKSLGIPRVTQYPGYAENTLALKKASVI